MPQLENISNEDLPNVLEQFYSEVRRKKKRDIGDETEHNENENESDQENDDTRNNYKSTTKGALCQHFKKTRGIDIISNEAFIQANSVFTRISGRSRISRRGACTR